MFLLFSFSSEDLPKVQNLQILQSFRKTSGLQEEKKNKQHILQGNHNNHNASWTFFFAPYVLYQLSSHLAKHTILEA